MTMPTSTRPSGPARLNPPEPAADALAHGQPPMRPKDVFGFALATRNFEISNFWLRSNYFLVLNSALALGFFNLKPGAHGWAAPLVAALGMLVCALWYRVALGSKFWQVHWERKLAEVEQRYVQLGALDAQLSLFGQSLDAVRAEVRQALADEHHHHPLQRWVDVQVVHKPSVTLAMIALAAAFALAWALVLGVEAWAWWRALQAPA